MPHLKDLSTAGVSSSHQGGFLQKNVFMVSWPQKSYFPRWSPLSKRLWYHRVDETHLSKKMFTQSDPAF